MKKIDPCNFFLWPQQRSHFVSADNIEPCQHTHIWLHSHVSIGYVPQVLPGLIILHQNWRGSHWLPARAYVSAQALYVYSEVPQAADVQGQRQARHHLRTIRCELLYRIHNVKGLVHNELMTLSQNFQNFYSY